MPFGLKNAGATYQRVATTLFHDMMHRYVEVYVDDMIVKSRDKADHLAALQRFIKRIRQFRLRLNPKKCTFGITSGKLLGHIVSECGIEVDPKKIRVILDVPAPRTEREIRLGHMYGHGILTWYGYLRLGHSLFSSPLVAFLGCSTRAYSFSFHLVSGVLVFSLVIYWHFLDVTLRHTLSSFLLRCLISRLFKSFSGVLMFILGHTPSFFVLLCLASFFGFSGTRLDPSPVFAWTIFRYSPEFYPFPVLAWILPFQYSPGFFLFLVLARILPFFGTRPKFTLF